MKLDNPYLSELEVDHLHHLGFGTDSSCVQKFKDVKFICLGGSPGRAQKFVKFINKELNINRDEEEVLTDLCLTDRYVMYKVGPVLVANHGMGVPSLRIILNELMKLLHYAKAKDVTFFRIGTSGGIGIDPGTVVLTEKAVNGCFEPKITNIVLGKVIEYSTEFQHSDFHKLWEVALDVHKAKPYEFIRGTTMCCDDFYEGQGRMDGAFCTFSKEERINYLHKAYDNGVRNFEMECSIFAAMCNQAEVSAFVVCVTLLNRFKGDQIVVSKEQLHEYEERPFDLVSAYIKSCLSAAI